MQLLHAAAKTHASFDDPNLVSHAGLVPVMRLASWWGWKSLSPSMFGSTPRWAPTQV
ncbi:hypothetical protein I546_6599 [Mycobacterium kansasii 732]|nr:hypothetical protein I546_6599 [Mycobacterium kansasii 732]